MTCCICKILIVWYFINSMFISFYENCDILFSQAIRSSSWNQSLCWKVSEGIKAYWYGVTVYNCRRKGMKSVFLVYVLHVTHSMFWPLFHSILNFSKAKHIFICYCFLLNLTKKHKIWYFENFQNIYTIFLQL